MNKKDIPKNFTLSLAIVDAIPVIFFSMTMIALLKFFPSRLFMLGSILIVFAGLCKVLWKFIVALQKKNIWVLFIQMRITMPIGFILIIVSFFVNKDMISIDSIIRNVLAFPQVTFFVLGTLGMLTMLIFAFSLDNRNLRNNWLEQIVNAISQIFFFVGIMLIK